MGVSPSGPGSCGSAPKARSVHGQRLSALQGAVAFRVDGVREERHVVAHLVGVASLR